MEAGAIGIELTSFTKTTTVGESEEQKSTQDEGTHDILDDKSEPTVTGQEQSKKVSKYFNTKLDGQKCEAIAKVNSP